MIPVAAHRHPSCMKRHVKRSFGPDRPPVLISIINKRPSTSTMRIVYAGASMYLSSLHIQCVDIITKFPWRWKPKLASCTSQSVTTRERDVWSLPCRYLPDGRSWQPQPCLANWQNGWLFVIDFFSSSRWDGTHHIPRQMYRYPCSGCRWNLARLPSKWKSCMHAHVTRRGGILVAAKQENVEPSSM